MTRTYTSSRFVAAVNVAIAPVAGFAIAGVLFWAGLIARRAGAPFTATAGLFAMAVLALALFGGLAYASLRIVTRIEVREDATVEFRGPLIRLALPATGITAVQAHPMVRSSAHVRHAGGRLPLCMPIDGLYEFLGWLKQANSRVEIRWL
ncbi:MAG TPA: hypothetical protein VFW08_07500 [bacterium]|nr:hypothetical protein [bacterium]